MCPEDEIIDALNSLEEDQGEQLPDDHEDTKKDPETPESPKSNRSSYKEEKRTIGKERKSLIANLEIQRKKELERIEEALKADISKLDEKSSDFPQKNKEICELSKKKKEEIEKEFDAKARQIEADFEKKDAELKEKYHDELTYKINPRLKRKEELINSDILLSVRHLKQFFFFGSKINNVKLKAVSNVSFDVKKGECFGIVGESGCGKTTTGRTIIKLYKPTSGSIYYRGYRIGAGPRWNQKEIKWTKKRFFASLKRIKQDRKSELASLQKDSPDHSDKESEIKNKYDKQFKDQVALMRDVYKTQTRKIRQINFDQNHTPKKLMSEIQMIFQDPIDSLDPRMTVEDIIQEGLRIQGHHNKAENHKKVVEMLEKVGLVEEHASRYPHEFSGGQRQRIGIARALVMNPKLLICDEPISALDVSIRAQIINLLNDLKEEMGLTIIFIAHDLSVVKYFCDRIAVMYYGKVVELADSDELFKHPLHPYTVSLLSAIPKPNPITEKNRIRITYKPNEVHDYAVDKPEFKEVLPGHFVYCNNKEFDEYQAKIKQIDTK